MSLVPIFLATMAVKLVSRRQFKRPAEDRSSQRRGCYRAARSAAARRDSSAAVTGPGCSAASIPDSGRRRPARAVALLRMALSRPRRFHQSSCRGTGDPGLLDQP